MFHLSDCSSPFKDNFASHLSSQMSQALASIGGKAADGVEAPDVADAVVVGDWWVLFKAIVIHITAIEGFAVVTTLCSDKTGTLTTNKLAIDRDTNHMPPPLLTTLSSLQHTHPAQKTRMLSMPPLFSSWQLGALGDLAHACTSIKPVLLDFDPFNLVNRTLLSQ